MLHKATTLQSYKLDSLDGEIGKVNEFYFDDRYWSIRYLVAETGSWLLKRQVLLSPHALVAAVLEDKNIAVSLTRRQIEESPHLGADKPVSRQFEDTYHGYYGWPGYWIGNYPMPIPVSTENEPEPVEPGNEPDPHLRSTEAVRGNHIEATDGEIGHVEDFIIDDENWVIRYLVIDTKNWWIGKKVLISPHWIERLSWDESKVFINLTRDAIRQSPEYSDEALLTREYEESLHTHYERKGYWAGIADNTK